MSFPQKFRRLTFSERGHFSNHFTLFPIRALEIGADYISISRRSTCTYRLSEVKRCQIRREESAKGYGRGAHGWYLRKTCSIECADGRRYVFDISDSFPDFENNDLLRYALKEKLLAEELPVERFPHAVWISISVVLILAAIAVKLA